MTTEVRQYLWLRLTVLGTGLAIFGSFIVASIQLWPIVHRVLVPTKLSCGCALLSVTTPIWLTIVAGLIFSLTMVLAGWFIGGLVSQVYRSNQLQRRLQQQHIVDTNVLSTSQRVLLVESEEYIALTIGFLRPKIYISHRLIERLTAEEVQVVLAHEQAHQRAYDPLVTAMMSIFSSIFFWLPGARHWMASAYSLRELAADAVATNGYKNTNALSSAFLKLNLMAHQPALSAFSPNRDRLEKLLDIRWNPPRHWMHRSVARTGLM